MARDRLVEMDCSAMECSKARQWNAGRLSNGQLDGRLGDDAMDKSRSAMKRMACDGLLGDGAMMECSKAWR